jgi:hypothetical protein
MRHGEIPFDGQAPWGSPLDTGYDVTLKPGDGGRWLPTLRIETDNSGAEYVFVQSFDDTGAFSPGYAIHGGIWQLGEEVAVPSWMRAAIERAGFRYDPEPNSQKRSRSIETVDDPGQTTLAEL